MTLLNSILSQVDAHYARHDWAAARDSLHVALGVAPNHPQLLATLGHLHFLLQEYQDACVAFSTAAQVDAENTELLVQLALSHRELAQFDEAQAVLCQVLESRPDDLIVIRLLADCYRDGDRPHDAAAIYQVLLERDCDHQIDILLSLVKLFAGVGDQAGLQAALAEVLRLEPDNQIARENSSALEDEVAATCAGRIPGVVISRGGWAAAQNPGCPGVARRKSPPRGHAAHRRRRLVKSHFGSRFHS